MSAFNGHGSPPPKLAVAMASHDMVPATFATDLATMVMHTVNALPDGAGFGVNLCSGTYVHSARQQLIVSLLNQGVTHILWVDTDMRFPRDALVRLLLHDLPMVGINYAKRQIPTEFVALKEISWDPDGVSERLVTGPESEGLEEVEAIGFGLVLMKTSALQGMPPTSDGPWFWFDWLEGQRQVGEDVYFCRLFRESGQRIFVDHDLSKLCAHIGQFEFRCEHAVEMAEVEVGV